MGGGPDSPRNETIVSFGITRDAYLEITAEGLQVAIGLDGTERGFLEAC